MTRSEGYEPRWDLDYARGAAGEVKVQSVIDGMTSGRTEVKTDDRAVSTGNVYIEHACRYGSEWRHSGITTTEADVWVFVVGDFIVGFPTDLLRAIHRQWLLDQRGLLECANGSHPTKGVVIPIRLLIEAARSLTSKQRRVAS